MTRKRGVVPILSFALIVGLWLGLQTAFYRTFIYHDAWKNGFPVLLSVGRQTTCGGLPLWLGRVDTGSPLVIYTITFSNLTHLLRIPVLWLIGCLDLGLVPAMYLTKAQIIAGHVALSGAMFVLGCVLFERRLAAIYLFVATLYAGLFLQAMHSDQFLWDPFWIPWAIACAVLAHRRRAESAGAWYLNGVVLFLSLAALEHYPHVP